MLYTLARGAVLAVCCVGLADHFSTGCGSVSNHDPGTSWLEPNSWNGNQYSLPNKYDITTPVPLLLYFHGWGSDYSECGSLCTNAINDLYGFMTVSLTGKGPRGWSSWKGFGSVASPGPDGPTCQTGTTSYCSKYSSCDCSQADNCWWTTCEDSVQQVSDILDYVEANFCINSTMVWAAGCSNGGMFLHELAQDQRVAARLAGIAPQVGLPHNGFNFGPAVPMHYIGFWGKHDTTVPPLSNTEDPYKSFDTSYSGWYYSTARNVTERWATIMQCEQREATTSWGIDYHFKLDCTVRSNCEDSIEVVECLFDAGHRCNDIYQWRPMLNFMLSHAKSMNPTGYVSTQVPLTSTTEVLSSPFSTTRYVATQSPPTSSVEALSSPTSTTGNVATQVPLTSTTEALSSPPSTSRHVAMQSPFTSTTEALSSPTSSTSRLVPMQSPLTSTTEALSSPTSSRYEPAQSTSTAEAPSLPTSTHSTSAYSPTSSVLLEAVSPGGSSPLLLRMFVMSLFLHMLCLLDTS